MVLVMFLVNYKNVRRAAFFFIFLSISLGRVVVLAPKIVINLPRTLKQTNKQTSFYLTIRISRASLLFKLLLCLSVGLGQALIIHIEHREGVDIGLFIKI